MRANESLLTSFVPIFPGQTLTGEVVFDLPAETAPATIELHDHENSAGAVITP